MWAGPRFGPSGWQGGEVFQRSAALESGRSSQPNENSMCSRYLDKPYWRRLSDKALFDQVFVGYGTLVWPGEIDIGPEDVWEFAVRHD